MKSRTKSFSEELRKATEELFQLHAVNVQQGRKIFKRLSGWAGLFQQAVLRVST